MGTAVFTACSLGGAYEVSGTLSVPLESATFTQSGTIKYYAIAGMTVAMDDGSGVQYLLTDHLGSVVAITDASGTLTSQQRYLPFGEVRTDLNGPRITETDFGYTGQRRLDEMGLMDYRARFYDPTIGRFVQPDTIISSYANPQTLNRFSYVLNRPIALNDPTGHKEMCGVFGEDCDDAKTEAEFARRNKEKKEAQERLQKCASAGPLIPPECDASAQTGMQGEPCTGDCSPGAGSPYPDDLALFMKWANPAIELMQAVESSMRYWRPLYQQVKFATSLGPLEYAMDGSLQMYDDRYLDLSMGQRFARGGIRALESGIIDVASEAIGSQTGLAAGAAVAGAASASGPGAVVAGAVGATGGYFVGVYATSTILTNAANRLNPTLFARVGLGGP